MASESRQASAKKKKTQKSVLDSLICHLPMGKRVNTWKKRTGEDRKHPFWSARSFQVTLMLHGRRLSEAKRSLHDSSL